MQQRPGNKQTKPGNRFSQNVIKLGSGEFIAQIISLGAVPIITRLYAPDDYGIFSIYLSIVMVLFPIATLRFNSALMLPKDRNDAANLLALSILSVIGCSILLAIVGVIIIAGGYYPKSWVEKGFAGYLWFIPLGVLIQGSVMSINFWALRHKMFGNMAIGRITESVIDRGLVVFFGYWGTAGALFLILGRIIGPFVELWFLLRRTLLAEIKVLWQAVSLPNMARLARRYREFHLMSTLAFFINNLGRTAPLLCLALFFSPLEIGLYGLATRVTSMPMMLIGDSVSKVFLQRATSKAEKRLDLVQDTNILFGYLIYISLPMVIVLFWFGKDLFELVFGPKWAEAGVYVQILSISFFAMFLYRPLSALFDAFERPRGRLIFNVVLLVGRVGAVFAGVYFGKTIIATLLTLTATTCLIYAGVYIYLFGLVGVGFGEIVSIITKKAAIMAPLLIGAPFLKLIVHDYYLISIFVVAGLLILQSGVMLTLEPGVKKQLLILMPFIPHKHSFDKQSL